jgi:hypothetical protein
MSRSDVGRLCPVFPWEVVAVSRSIRVARSVLRRKTIVGLFATLVSIALLPCAVAAAASNYSTGFEPPPPPPPAGFILGSVDGQDGWVSPAPRMLSAPPRSRGSPSRLTKGLWTPQIMFRDSLSSGRSRCGSRTCVRTVRSRAPRSIPRCFRSPRARMRGSSTFRVGYAGAGPGLSLPATR